MPSSPLSDTCLHKAIFWENGKTLHIVDFLVQNSRSLDAQNKDGNTPLHYCVMQNKVECMRLLLRSKADPGIENKKGKFPQDIATERNNTKCEEMLLSCLSRSRKGKSIFRS